MMKLDLNKDITIAAKEVIWYDEQGYGLTQVAGVEVRYTMIDTITMNYDPFYWGAIIPEDLKLLPEGYIASLTNRCASPDCPNTIDAEEQFCNQCLENATDPSSEDGSLDTYREPLGVLLAEEAQREHDPLF